MRLRQILKTGFVVVGLSALAACNTDELLDAKHLEPIPYATLADMKSRGMAPEDPILLRIFKEESQLEVWKEKDDGTYGLMKTYDICKWSGKVGPKFKEGDRQAPEGFYTVTPAQMNPNSSYYLSFNMGFPNKFDRSHGRTGSHLMVHGACSSRGCYAMTDEQIGEIYALAREAFKGGQKGFQIQAYPFRMTPENLARYADNEHLDFWRMLKRGHDHFELTKQVPKVDVCDRRYIFNAEADGGNNFSASGKCPAYSVPERLAFAVEQKTAADDRAFELAVQSIADAAERDKRWKEREKKLAALLGAKGPDAVDVPGSADADTSTAVKSSEPPKPAPNPKRKADGEAGGLLPSFSWFTD
ncbi:murein L,D-transpeptidase family protein [Coralliovum pocilloporae]|uniref:murein L,D-transpeptidase family protein n=1 Tax=Coralliovum pocilloporae TaxID=3066369 RepID=UPI00330782AF